MKTKKPKMYRQGDVMVMEVDRRDGLDEVPREDGRIVLAHGEVTGHAHVITSMDATLFMDAKTLDRFLDVRAPVIIGHEEHNRIELPSGYYQVRQQREYRPEGIRRVAD